MHVEEELENWQKEREDKYIYIYNGRSGTNCPKYLNLKKEDEFNFNTQVYI